MVFCNKNIKEHHPKWDGALSFRCCYREACRHKGMREMRNVPATGFFVSRDCDAIAALARWHKQLFVAAGYHGPEFVRGQSILVLARTEHQSVGQTWFARRRSLQASVAAGRQISGRHEGCSRAGVARPSGSCVAIFRHRSRLFLPEPWSEISKPWWGPCSSPDALVEKGWVCCRPHTKLLPEPPRRSVTGVLWAPVPIYGRLW